MKEYKPTWYESPISLPARRVGTAEIRHRIIKKGEEVLVIGGRQAVLRGLPRTIIKAPKRFVVHELYEHMKRGQHMWMTDLPEELNQIGELLHRVQPQGRVLVGGLGLGILAKTVAALRGVSEVVVVEKSKDIIRLCYDPLAGTGDALPRNVRQDIPSERPYRVVHSAIHRYLLNTRTPFDFYLLDTWGGSNEGTWWTEVMPLRRAIRNRFGTTPTIHCWAEDMMWSQIIRTMTCPLTKPHWFYSHLPVPMEVEDAVAFLNMVGTRWWELKYGAGVNRYITEQKLRRA